MVRTSGKALAGATAVAAALMWVMAHAAAAQNSQKPAYARVVVSDKSVVYIQIQGNELRAAMSLNRPEQPEIALLGRMRRKDLDQLCS